MHAQRVRGAESRVEMQIVKWAAEGAVKGKNRSRVFCDVRHTSVAEICQYLVRVQGIAEAMFCESGWHRGMNFVPDRQAKSVRDFFMHVHPVSIATTRENVSRFLESDL